MMDAGAYVNTTDNEEKTALFYAVQDNNERMVRALIDAGADNITDNEGKTALFYAVQDNNESMVRALIDAGADVNTTDNEGKTALFYAVQENNESMVRTLIDANAFLNTCDIENKTALIHAVDNSKEAAAVALIKAGADVNKSDKMLRTCLIYAVINENEYLTNTLIEAKADVNAIDVNIKTALIHAVYNEKDVLLRALIQAGANLNIRDIDEKTALICAIENSNVEAAIALIEAGADLNIRDKWLKTAMAHAVLCDNEQLVSALIARGVNVNASDRDKRSALTLAVLQKSENIALKLIDAGTDVNLADKDKKTPLIYAAENEYNYLCFSLVDGQAADKSRICSIDAVADNFQKFICKCFQLTDNIPEDIWLSSVTEELNESEREKVDEPNEAWLQAYRNVRSYCHEWERVLINAIQDDKQVVSNLVHQGSSFIFSNYEFKVAITCTAILEHDMIVQGNSSLSERQNKGLVWIEDFITRITSNERKPALIESLLKAGADVNQTDIDGKSAFIRALQKGKKHLANILIHHGAKVNIFDKTGRTALIYAVKNNESRDMVQSLIKAGAEINHTDNKGKTALFYAVHNEDYSLTQVLIEAGADVNLTDASSKSVLIYAVEDEKEWLASKLIENGADVNITDKKCRTPLMYAVQNETEYLARALIKAGSDVNASDNEFKTALIHAVEYKNKRLATFLISQGTAVNLTDNEWKTALIHAVKDNEESDLVHALITAGTDVNTIDKEEKSALIYAVQNENRTLTTALIKAGTDVNITDNQEATALIYSVQNKNKFLANKLIEAGSEINFADSKKKTALIYAVQHQLEDITVSLIEAKANVNDADDEGKTALFYAVQNEFLVSTLMKAGADANINDNHSRTPLFYAVANEFVVRRLVEDGKCVVNSRDVYGRTPLCYALTTSLSSSHYLLGKGEDIDSKDFFGLSNLSFFIDYFLLRKIDKDYLSEGLKFFVAQEVSFNTVFKTIINAIFCKILSSNLVLSPAFDAVVFARQYAADGNIKATHDDVVLQNILKLMREESLYQNCTWESQVPKVLPLLIALGANPNSVDSDGNTALHYAACLPFMGVSQETVIKICFQLQEFEVLFNIKNHQGETPLLFCLRREVDLINIQKEKKILVDVEELVYVLTFLLEHGASVEETTSDGQSILHLVLKLFHQGLRSLKGTKERNILDEALRLFNLFASAKRIKGITVNRRGHNLISPLHLWASLTLNSEQGYGQTIWKSVELQRSPNDDPGYEKMTMDTLDFKKLSKKIFQNLLKYGVRLNDRNAKEETPLHLCRSWTAVELLLDAGANPKDVDEFGRPPLLTAAKKRNFGQNSSCFYPDISKEFEPEAFWITALKKGLDPWTVDKNGESVLSILIASEAFLLAKALLEVAIKKKYIQSNTIALSLLNAICKDDSTRAHWKSTLVKMILESRKFPVAVESEQDTPLHYCCRNIVRNPEESSVHWTIAKLLLASGADYQISNKAGKTCLDIANSHPGLKEFLEKPINIDDVPLLIPWLTVSKRYQPILAKTARRQESWHVEPYWCHEEHLASGSFGLVFAGINEKDGREVAIKRTEKQRMKRREDKREIQSLTALANCEQVVRYLSFSEDEHFCYVVLELMEGNLDDYLENNYSEPETLRLCKDIVKGLQFLHEHSILHRDLKPTNILYRCHPKLCLKIADFGLSRRIDSTGSSSVYGPNVGTRCWIAPEVLRSDTGHSKSSDIFACGLVLHYTFSGKTHPFVSTYCDIKNISEAEDNILNDNKEGWNGNLSPEAAHLIERLLLKEAIERPTATAALAHPFFWPKKKKLDFLIAVGNQQEFGFSRAKRTLLTALETELEARFGTIVKYVKWNNPGYAHMPAIYTEMTKRRTYQTNSVVELVRFIRNAYAHVTELPNLIQDQLLKDFVFFEYFPNLVIEVYKAVTTHGWDQTREEIRYFLKK
ncbi:uncharacterized protein LOC116308594 [Actinia tenebrosa]|uniref:Uncharacterized protein LOC116308594 n=1 Tax=Actinia tenebrosa TaxID=6105 RepID=A0A6P8J4E6_ACTTE|nr:uncharacterized protein LOC116308594 [Actinia tenebrosa]